MIEFNTESTQLEEIYLICFVAVISFLLFTNEQESDQTGEYFNIGDQEAIRIASLNTGDCFNLVNENDNIDWNTYVQYRACDTLHDGEVFYRENQLDFGDQTVGYTNLLNFFTETCTNEFAIYKNSEFLTESFDILYLWDTESQSLGTKPFDMLCLTLSENRTKGSYVEDITGIAVLLPNPETSLIVTTLNLMMMHKLGMNYILMIMEMLHY